MNRRNAPGFTLIELLVVLALVGLSTGAVLMTLPDGEAALHRQADSFALQLRRAQEEAILSGRAMQVGVNVDGYHFSRQEFGRWQALEQAPFAPRAWAGGARALLPQRQKQLGFRFDPTGATEPQQVLLARGDERVRISIDPAGQVRIDGTMR